MTVSTISTTSIPTVTCRQDDAARRLALPPPHLDPASPRAGRPAGARQARARVRRRCGRRGRSGRHRRADPAVGRPPHRRDLADAQRSAGAAGRVGPVRAVRNPLYLGNIVLWVGFASSARLLWLAPVIVASSRSSITRSCGGRNGCSRRASASAYREYAARVPRWIPQIAEPRRSRISRDQRSRGARLFVERDVVQRARHADRDRVGYVLLWLKAQ